MRDMKWYIYHQKQKEYLYWDDRLLEFDTEESANRFFRGCIELQLFDIDETNNIIIKNLILFSDDLIFNATNHIVIKNKDTNENELYEVVSK